MTERILLSVVLAIVPACNEASEPAKEQPPTAGAVSSASAPEPSANADAPAPSQASARPAPAPAAEPEPEPAPKPALETKFEPALLATIPAETSLTQIELSPVGHQVAYVATADDQEWVTVGDEPHERFDRITGLYWSPAGAPLAYTATRGGSTFVVVDGQVSGPYPGTTIPQWSPDGATLVYGAESVLVVGGKKVVPVAPVWEHAWRPDNRLVYIAMRGPGDKVIITGPDDEPSESFEYSLGLHWSADGRHLAYAASVGEGMVLVVDGKRTAQPGIEGDMRWNADGSTLAYKRKDYDTGEVTLMVGDQLQGPFAEVGEVVWSPDAKQIAFPARKGEKLQLLGAHPSATFDGVSTPKWSPDSTRVAFVATKGNKEHVVIGELAGETFDQVYPDSLAWSPDSTTIAYLAKRDGKRFVVAGSTTSEAHEWADGPRWSRDGAKVAYGIRQGSELRWVVLPVS